MDPLRRGEVVLILMRFHQSPGGGKVRPALVLLDERDDDFVAAPITSREPQARFDLSIRDWSSAGLNVPSTVRLHKLNVLPKADVIRRLGSLAPADHSALAHMLAAMWND